MKHKPPSRCMSSRNAGRNCASTPRPFCNSTTRASGAAACTINGANWSLLVALAPTSNQSHCGMSAALAYACTFIRNAPCTALSSTSP
ncbi:hypothetical protein D3C79_908450 [compost metagenome]